MVTMSTSERSTHSRIEGTSVFTLFQYSPLWKPDWAVGCHVRLLTTLEEVIEGTVFAFDPLSNCLVISEDTSTSTLHDFRVLKASFIKRILSASLPDHPIDRHLPYVDFGPPQSEEEETPEEPERVEREPTKEIPTPEPEMEPVKTPELPPAIEEPPNKEPVNRVSTYASISKGVDQPMPVVASTPAPKGPWGVKNPRITSGAPYAQVAANAQQAQNSEGEGSKNATTGAPGMVTMSLKPRLRH